MIWRSVGIVGAGVYIPDYRIGSGEIASDQEASGIGGHSKSVPGRDEDAASMAVEAGLAAVADAGIDARDLEVVWVGSESKPHSVRSITATVVDALGAGPWIGGADFEFACRGATDAFIAAAERIESGSCRYALVIGADAAQGSPGDELEKSAGAGAAAFVLGPAQEAIATISSTVTYLSDTPDFYRRDGAKYPRHTYRFTGEPSYFQHVENAIQKFFEQTSSTAADFRYAVFHQPNNTFPRKVAKLMGFEPGQVNPLMLFQQIGNPYAANWAIGVVNSLEHIDAGDQILVSTYGSGAGADCFALHVTERFQSKPRLAPFLQQGHPVSYLDYLTMTRAIESST